MREKSELAASIDIDLKQIENLIEMDLIKLILLKTP